MGDIQEPSIASHVNALCSLFKFCCTGLFHLSKALRKTDKMSVRRILEGYKMFLLGVVGRGKGVVYRDVQLTLAYSWIRPTVLASGKGRRKYFLFLLFLFYLFFFLSPLSFHFLYYLFYLSSPFLWETTKSDPRVVKPHNQNKINK